MSRRPSDRLRAARNQQTGSTTAARGYAIIGSTASAVLYARRLLANGVTVPIYILTEGDDSTNRIAVQDPEFIMLNADRQLQLLKTEQVDHAGFNEDEVIADADLAIIVSSYLNRTTPYYVGAGPVGDFISAYFIPRAGPWLPSGTSLRLEAFLKEFTVRSQLNFQEQQVADRLSNMWRIPQTSALVVSKPSMLNCHYTFIFQKSNDTFRELFFNIYNDISQRSNVSFYNNVGDLTFEPGTVDGYHIFSNAPNSVDIDNVRVVWRTNPFSYLRIASVGGLNPRSLELPAFYRAVIPIPFGGTGYNGCVCTCADQNCGCYGPCGSGCDPNNVGVSGCTAASGSSAGCTCQFAGINLSCVEPSGDFIYTHNTFSMYGPNQNKQQSVLDWLCQAYTTTEDFSVVDPGGRFAAPGKILLIVEGIAAGNKRNTVYNVARGESVVNYNSVSAEYGYLVQFGTLVADILAAYTGVRVTPLSLIDRGVICTPSGVCEDGNVIEAFSLRESPMVTLLQMAANLYGLSNFVNPGNTS